jgi:hypothetical protein
MTTGATAIEAGDINTTARLHHFPSQGVASQQAAKTDHVQIAVLDTLMRGKVFANQTGPNPGSFICGNARRRSDTNAFWFAPTARTE